MKKRRKNCPFNFLNLKKTSQFEKVILSNVVFAAFIIIRFDKSFFSWIFLCVDENSRFWHFYLFISTRISIESKTTWIELEYRQYSIWKNEENSTIKRTNLCCSFRWQQAMRSLSTSVRYHWLKVIIFQQSSF